MSFDNLLSSLNKRLLVIRWDRGPLTLKQFDRSFVFCNSLSRSTERLSDLEKCQYQQLQLGIPDQQAPRYFWTGDQLCLHDDGQLCLDVLHGFFRGAAISAAF